MTKPTSVPRTAFSVAVAAALLVHPDLLALPVDQGFLANRARLDCPGTQAIHHRFHVNRSPLHHASLVHRVRLDHQVLKDLQEALAPLDP